MKKELSVQFCKRVITFTVLGIIVVLLILTIYFKIQYNNAMSYGNSKKTESTNNTVSIETEKEDYTSKYKDMYVKRSKQDQKKSSKVVYFTFDDGPSTTITNKILDVLKKYKIKATFFMVYKNSPEEKKIIKRVIKEGHTIGIHTASHDYEKIYKSVDAYLKDFNKMDEYLKKEFNYTPTIFRFPGGSINEYNLFIYNKIVPEMYRRGYTFYDWNVASGDATTDPISSSQIKNAVVSQCAGKNKSIVLMHDSYNKTATLEALPSMIETLKKKGYTFKALDNSVKPVTFIGNV